MKINIQITRISVLQTPFVELIRTSCLRLSAETLRKVSLFVNSVFIIQLQATRKLVSDTNGFSATRTQILMLQILPKRPSSKARNWHCRGWRCIDSTH